MAQLTVLASVGTTNDGHRLLVWNGKSVSQAHASLGNLLATIKDDVSVQHQVVGVGDGVRASDDKCREVQPDLANVSVGLADLGTASSWERWGAGDLKVGAVLSCAAATAKSDCNLH